MVEIKRMKSGIRIEVETRYVEGESDPKINRYVFAYTITIANLGDSPAQLLSRHWHITNANGEVAQVVGPGVVGKQPRIEPGSAFRYTSAAILETPVGSMHGEYEFQRDDGEKFLAPIAAFSLSMPNVVH
jgi:ApaG protein